MKDKTKRRIIRWFWILFTAPFAILALALLIVFLFAKIPSFKELEHPDSKQATQIISDDGKVLTTFHIENRTFVDYDDISPNVVAAAVSTEDIRFYEHSGIDFKGLGRVLVKTLWMKDTSQGGGSTITQQLAKTLYPRHETESDIPGWNKLSIVWIKFKEWITAVKLETNYTKDEIMDMYLNSIFFGSSSYGIQTASRTFFNKEPKDLTVEESATLIGMVNKPTRYNPRINPEQSKERRDFVIGQMEKAGYITAAQRDSLVQIPIKLDFQQIDHNTGEAPYFRDMLRRDMMAEKPRRSDYEYKEDYSADSLRWEDDDLYGWVHKNKKANGREYNIDKDGLRIYTTINAKMQKYAEEAVMEHLGGRLQENFWADLRCKRNAPFSNSVDQATRESVMMQSRKWSDRYRMMHRRGVPDEEIFASFDKPEKMSVFTWVKNRDGSVVPGTEVRTMTPNDSIKYYKSLLRAAMMAIEPNTGHVKAYVGGPCYRYFKYDNVGQGKRQIGSTVKPFIYSLALTEGMSPCDRVANVPQTFDLPGGGTWTPKGGAGGVLTLKQALTASNNNVSAFLIRTLGPASVAEHMHRMGVTGHIEEVYPLCVGCSDASVKDMVTAYNVFPSKGVYISPTFVTRIEDSHGNVITEFSSTKREVLGMDETFQMINMMASVINNGTGRRLRPEYHVGGDISGKTGTTNDNSDGWFIGYTPTICAGVWVGGENRQIHFQSTALGQGANMALPIWGRFVRKCQADDSLPISANDHFVIPQGVDTKCESGYFLGGDDGRWRGSGNSVRRRTDGDAGESEEYYFN